MDITELHVGDIIRIKTLDDPFLNINYKNREGEITKINIKQETIKGTWGGIELYPQYDEIEVLTVNN